MTCILIVGDAGDDGLPKLITGELSRSYCVTYINGGVITKQGSGYELLALDLPQIDCCNLDECILLLKADGITPAVKLPERSIIIANADNQAQLDALSRTNAAVITCGGSSRDTLTFSSLTEDDVVISLGREITAFSGKKIEPLEIPAKLPKSPDGFYDALAFTALRLVLDDFDSEIGGLI
jgi:hypothetical protein